MPRIADQFPVEPLLVACGLLVVEARRDIQHGLVLEIEGRVEQKFARRVQPDPSFYIVEGPEARERGGGKDRGVQLSEEVFAQRLGDVDGRGHEAVALVLPLGPVHEALLSLIEVPPDGRSKATRPPREGLHFLLFLEGVGLERQQRVLEHRERPAQDVGDDAGLPHAKDRLLLQHVVEVQEEVLGREPEVVHDVPASVDLPALDLEPREKPLAGALAQEVVEEIADRKIGHLDAEIIRGHVLDLVRLVEDDGLVLGQDVAARGHVGEEEVVVRHEHLGLLLEQLSLLVEAVLVAGRTPCRSRGPPRGTPFPRAPQGGSKASSLRRPVRVCVDHSKRRFSGSTSACS